MVIYYCITILANIAAIPIFYEKKEQLGRWK